MDSPREDQGRQIGGDIGSSGWRRGLCVMVMLSMWGANQIWGKASVMNSGRDVMGRRRQHPSSRLAWRHEQSLGPGYEGTDKLTGQI